MLLHISLQHDLDGMWLPKLPAGGPDEDNGAGEPDTPRICAGLTLKQCFWAIYPNVSKRYENCPGLALNFAVYEIPLPALKDVVFPRKLTDKRHVWDAHVTGEHWVTAPVFVRKIGSVGISVPDPHNMLMTRMFGTGKWVEFAPANVRIDWRACVEFIPSNNC